MKYNLVQEVDVRSPESKITSPLVSYLRNPPRVIDTNPPTSNVSPMGDVKCFSISLDKWLKSTMVIEPITSTIIVTIQLLIPIATIKK